MKAKVFVGSSVEGLEIAYAVRESLSLDAEVTVWAQAAFRVTEDGLSTLLRTAAEFDAAIIILTPDDYVATRGASRSPRDNIILELGLFIGAIGRERIFVLSCGTDQRFALPTDLAGVNHWSIALRAGASSTAAVSAFCKQVADRLKSLSAPAETVPERSQTHRGTVFVSYSHKDLKWLNHLQTMLQPIIRQDRIGLWDDTRIQPGKKWKGEIEEALKRASVAVLLVSPYFLASEFIAQDELPPLLAKAERGGLTIIWIAISASFYSETPIAAYQAANNPARPLDSLKASQRNRELLRICEQIIKAADAK
jgi:predicted nucleotide-binding protein